jgi:hypothetical protein
MFDACIRNGEKQEALIIKTGRPGTGLGSLIKNGRQKCLPAIVDVLRIWLPERSASYRISDGRAKVMNGT